MKVIGLTGGVGTGKSTVARMFARLGAHVVDADQLTHALLKPRTAVSRRIRAAFGAAIFSPDGSIHRPRLGALVFSDRKCLARLNAIVHPAVRQRIRQQVQAIWRRDPAGVVMLDVPLLLEAGAHYRVDAVVVVSASLKSRARRLKARSGWGVQELKRRQSFQMPLRKKEQMADFVIRNNGSLADTRRQVARVWKQIKES